MKESAATKNAFERLRAALHAQATTHRHVHPPSDPSLCCVCPADAQEFYVIINRERYCLRCGMDAMAGAS